MVQLLDYVGTRIAHTKLCFELDLRTLPIRFSSIMSHKRLLVFSLSFALCASKKSRYVRRRALDGERLRVGSALAYVTACSWSMSCLQSSVAAFSRAAVPVGDRERSDLDIGDVGHGLGASRTITERSLLQAFS